MGKRSRRKKIQEVQVSTAITNILPSVVTEAMFEWLELSSLLRFKITSKGANVTEKVLLKVIFSKYPYLSPETLEQTLKVCPTLGLLELVSKQLAIIRARDVVKKIELPYRPVLSQENYCFTWRLSSGGRDTVEMGVNQLEEYFLVDFADNGNTSAEAIKAEAEMFLTLQVIDKRSGRVAELCHTKYEVVEEDAYEECTRLKKSFVHLGLHKIIDQGNQDDYDDVDAEFCLSTIIESNSSEKCTTLLINFEWFDETQMAGDEERGDTCEDISDVLIYLERFLVFR